MTSLLKFLTEFANDAPKAYKPGSGTLRVDLMTYFETYICKYAFNKLVVGKQPEMQVMEDSLARTPILTLYPSPITLSGNGSDGVFDVKQPFNNHNPP